MALFNINLNVTINLPPPPVPGGENGALGDIEKGIEIMSKELDDLTKEVSENNDAVQSAITLINGLAQQIIDLKDDPAALEALATSLNTQTEALAAAVTANTPAAPPPPAPEPTA